MKSKHCHKHCWYFWVTQNFEQVNVRIFEFLVIWSEYVHIYDNVYFWFVSILPDEAGNHAFNKGGFTGPFQGQCIVPSCKNHPRTFCLSCTRDVSWIVYVCKPSATKQCWNILHQARCPHPVDQQGNPIEHPKLTRKRRRNSSHGTQRVSPAQKKPLVLNPHHAQLEGW